MKLGLIYAISSRKGNVVELVDLQKAHGDLTEIEKEMPFVLELITSTERGAITDLVYRTIKREKVITRAELLQRFSHRMGNKELLDYLETLILSRRITCVVENGEPIYRLKKGPPVSTS